MNTLEVLVSIVVTAWLADQIIFRIWKTKHTGYQQVKLRLVERREEGEKRTKMLVSISDETSSLSMVQLIHLRSAIDDGVKEMRWREFMRENKEVGEYVCKYPEEERTCKVIHGFGPDPEKEDWQEQVKRRWDDIDEAFTD